MSSSTDAAGDQPRRFPKATLAASILGSSLAFIDGSVVNVALPAFDRVLHAGATGLAWMISAYLLTLSALTLLGGALGDHFGRRRIFLIGIGLFLAASLACAAAPALPEMLVARAIQGVGAALLMPNSLAILGAGFEGTAQGQAIGTWAGVGALASAIGPMLGGWLVETAGWRSIFLVILPVGMGACWLAWRFVPESRNHRVGARLDLLGGLIVLLPFVLIRAEHYSPVEAGASMLPIPILIALGSRLMGRVAANVGARMPLGIGALIVAGGLAPYLRLGPAGGGYWSDVLPATLMVAFDMAICVAPLTTTVISAEDADHMGAASGFNSAVARMGGLIATALLGFVFVNEGTQADLLASAHKAALIGSVMAALAGTFALVLIRRPATGRNPE